MLFRLVPLFMLLLPPVIQVFLSVKSMRGKIRISLGYINVIALVLGLILPVIATIISMATLPAGTKCATGCIGCAFLGWLITIIFVPVIAAFTYMLRSEKTDKLT